MKRWALPKLLSIVLVAIILSLVLPPSAEADGIPEPDLILYGVIRNTTGGLNTRLIQGTLDWTFQAPGGNPVKITAELQNINDQFSYVLRIPCQTEVAGLTIAANTLKLTSSPIAYNRSTVLIDGFVAKLVLPAGPIMNLTSLDRGRIERVDLEVNVPITDTDGNGLPDAWERAFFGRIGVGAAEDADGDGASNAGEYKAGTDPANAASLFEFIEIKPDPLGGVLVRWSSVESRSYALERSGNLLSGYATIQTSILATPPVNSHRDGTAAGAGPYFYRIRLFEP